MTTKQLDRPGTTGANALRLTKFDPQAKAPAAAFAFAASHVKFAAEEGTEQSKSKPFEMVVRSAEAIPHWYFGLIVHDFAGMKIKPVVAIDYNHDSDELIGKASEFDTSSGDLVARGSVESIEVGDCADKVIKRSAAGIPYEASIYFDPYELTLENVPEGFVAEANGRTYEGPVVIAREWMLRRIAITPSGVDPNSEVRFSSSESATMFSLNWKVNNMETGKPADSTPTPATPATPAVPPVDTVDPRTAFQLELKRYNDKFGAADGATYFAAGLTYEQALEQHVAKLEAARQASDAAKLSAEQKLAALNLGETSPVQSGGAKPTEAETSFSTCFKGATKKANQAAIGV
jgi:hypothetical protein